MKRFTQCLGLVMLLISFIPKMVVGNTLTIKMNTLDCHSCLLSLNQLDQLKSTIKLVVLVEEEGSSDFVKNQLPNIVSRPYDVLVSSQIFDSLPLDRSSYYLQDRANKIVIFDHLGQMDVVLINLKSIELMPLDTMRLCSVEEGRNYLARTKSGYLIAHNISKNSISVFDKGYQRMATLIGSQISREIVYKALHKGDTSNFWEVVTRKAESLKKYGMYDLRFESLSIAGDSCFLLATSYEVELVRVLGGVDNVYTPRLLLFAFASSNLYKPQLRPVDDLPSKYTNRFGLDNTQKIFVNGSSENILIGVYKDDLRGHNRIFASYQMKKGRYYFKEWTKHKLPKTFKADKLVYEGNLYDISGPTLVFLQTGDYINLESEVRGNLELGKTILKREGQEIKVLYNWIIEGYHLCSNHHLIVVFYEDGNRKIAIVDNRSMEVKEVLSVMQMNEFAISSNILIDDFGKLVFHTKDGYLVQM